MSLPTGNPSPIMPHEEGDLSCGLGPCQDLEITRDSTHGLRTELSCNLGKGKAASEQITNMGTRVSTTVDGALALYAADPVSIPSILCEFSRHDS